MRGQVRTLQVNVGKRCNMACHHCHVDAGPKRTEMMARLVAERVMELLSRSPETEVLDLTGGAPELNPHFRWLVGEARRLGRRVIDRCNLTVCFEPGQEDLPELLAEHGVEIVASLPCYSAENVEKQRGRGAFDKSIDALRLLNRLGYGTPGSGRKNDTPMKTFRAVPGRAPEILILFWFSQAFDHPLRQGLRSLGARHQSRPIIQRRFP
jgi:radical SAM/Cys-rich protein